MPINMQDAAIVISLQEEVKAAIAVINKASSKLNAMGMEVKVSGWDWSRPGWNVSLSPQGGLVFKFEDLTNRPGHKG